MSASQEFWKELFGGDKRREDVVVIPMRLLRRHGHPFLLLPAQGRLAATALELYAAQTPRARMAKTLMRWSCRTGLVIGMEKVLVTVLPPNHFVRFLSGLAGVAEPAIARFGVLAGNPASPGQRFLVMVFDQNQRPAGVVKAGVNEAARALIQREEAFLTSLSGKIAGIPGVRAKLESPGLCALAMDFFDGASPRAQNDSNIPRLLTGWVNAERKIPLLQTPVWVQLQQAASAREQFRTIAERLGGAIFSETIYHGDLTPWNIKVSRAGEWIVLDWERGERAGVPGWDWFHYVLQTGILVEGQPTEQLVQRIEGLLRSEAFKHYAIRAAISGLDRWLVLAYLLYCVEVIKPAEGLEATRRLLDALYTRWETS